jgi:putative ABC transport system ATP-binding protein
MAREGIQLAGVTKSFRNGANITPVLKGVSLEIAAGEKFYIVGPSGCGKTTLLSVLCGTLDAEGGEVRVLGHDLRRLGSAKVTEFRKRHVGFVFQQFNLIPTLTAAENVAVPLKLLGSSSAAAPRAAAEILDRVGLGEKLHERPVRLSGGQQQRVAIARALVHQPALIVCDEPTSALDSETGREVMALLGGGSGSDARTVIVVTHDPRIYHYADWLAEMEDGRVLRTVKAPSAPAIETAPHLATTNH